MSLFRSKSKFAKNKIYSPADGTTRELEDLEDGVFSERIMGDGIVITTPEDVPHVSVLAPIAGEVVTAFPTGHAYGIKTKDGLEVLIHIGLETVNLNGTGFKMRCKQGDKVKVGDHLADVDMNFVRKSTPTGDIIMVITSRNKILESTKGDVKAEQDLITVVL